MSEPLKKKEQRILFDELSWRAKNSCLSVEIKTTKDLVEYIKAGGNFNNVRNCREETRNEILNHPFLFKYLAEEILEDELKLENFSSEYFKSKEKLKVRSKNGLGIFLNQDNEVIEFLSKCILNYIDFNSLKNIGALSVTELDLFRESVMSKPLKNKKQKNFLEELSKRAKNICLSVEIKTVNDLFDYIKTGGDFKNMRNCGEGIRNEILNHLDHTLLNKQLIEEILEDKYKFEMFSSKYFKSKEKLKARSKNALEFFLDQDNEVIDFLSKCIINDIDFNSLKNIGALSVAELDLFRENAKNLVNEISREEFREIDILLREFEIEFGFTDANGDLKRDLEERRLNLIAFFDQFIIHGTNFNDIECDMILTLIDPQIQQIESFKSIAKQHNLSKERVRQISKKIGNKCSDKCSNIFNITKYSFDLQDKIDGNDYFFIEEQSLGNCKPERVSNSATNLANLLSLVENESFFILSKSQKIPGKLYPFDHATHKIFRKIKVDALIKTAFISRDIVNEALHKFYIRLTDRITQDYSITIANLIKHPLTDGQSNFLVSLISCNFQIKTENNQLLLKRNTPVTITETVTNIIKNILLEINEPLTIDQIASKYNSISTVKYRSENDLRAILNRKNEIFITLRGAESSGKSKYGLIEWEETKGLKGGSIVNLCYEILNESNLPVHILELTRQVSKHRQTTQINIHTNLKLNNNHKFVFYSGGFVGLSQKIYNKNLIGSFKNIVGVQYFKVINFIKNNAFYNEGQLIEKFKSMFGTSKIQIEQILEKEIERGVFKRLNEKIYYNRNDEDRIMDLLIKAGSTKYSGHNPYLLEINDFKISTSIKINASNDINHNMTDLDQRDYYLNASSFQLLIYYQKNTKKWMAIAWNDENLREIVNKINFFSFPSDDVLKAEKLNNYTYLFQFDTSKLEDFISTLKILNNSNFDLNKTHEGSFDLSKFNIDGLKKIDAYSAIINTAEHKYNRVITLSEAKQIYTTLSVRI